MPSKSFIGLVIMFRSLVQFEFVFVYGSRSEFPLHFFFPVEDFFLHRKVSDILVIDICISFWTLSSVLLICMRILMSAPHDFIVVAF